MKSLSNFLHTTPWWAMLLGGLVSFIALAVFVTPFHLIKLQKSGATPEENRAIKREVDLTFSEGAVDLAGSIVKEMRDHTRDPVRRDELDRALEEIDTARQSLREAGAEVLRAKREAAQNVTDAVKEASKAIADAQKEAARALKEAGVDDEKVTKALEESANAAKKAGEEARIAAAESRASRAAEKLRRAEERVRAKLPGVALPGLPAPPATLAPAMPAPAAPAPPAEPGIDGAKPEKNRIVIMSPNKDKTLLDIDLSDHHGENVILAPGAPLPPELRAQIREKVTGDLWRIGVGSGLILIFIPLFILAMISKFFIDRSRASLQLAELKRKEAEYHRMSQQVTEAKLSALQAQVEPHFLYNTLASVQALTEVDPQQASAMTGHLIQYLRNALPKMRESVSTVGQEIELVRAYLNILQMRMGKRLSFDIAVPPELMDAPFPPLMLPSLVENAIKHGLEPQREGGEVRIGAEAADGKLRLIVSDTGKGFAETLGTGVGLTNIRERLAAMYGDAAKLTLAAREPHGVVVTIEVPRDGARAMGAAAPADAPAPPASAQAAAPQGAAARTLAVMGAMERGWRKGLTFTFTVLVVVTAVAAGLAILGVMTGTLPVRVGDAAVGSATGAFLGTAGIAVAFAVMVIALAIVLAIVYGLGFLFVGLAIFIPIVVLVALFPVLSPFLLLGLAICWLVRRGKRKAADNAGG
jgi:Histidine kinase